MKYARPAGGPSCRRLACAASSAPAARVSAWAMLALWTQSHSVADDPMAKQPPSFTARTIRGRWRSSPSL
jgi:hypothetical protein